MLKLALATATSKEPKQSYFGVDMFIIAELKDDKGQVVGVVSAPPKEFKTGSRGFFGMGKLEIEGKRYQIQVQIVEIGSKQNPAADS